MVEKSSDISGAWRGLVGRPRSQRTRNSGEGYIVVMGP